MTRHMRTMFPFVVSLVVVSSGAACDDELSDEELIDRARNAREHESTSSERATETSSISNSESSTESTSDDTPPSSPSPSSSADAGSNAAPSSPSETDDASSSTSSHGDATATPSRDEHAGFCHYGVRQTLMGDSSMVSSLSGRVRMDDQGRIATIVARTDFPQTEPKTLSQQEILSYGDSTIELVDHEEPRTAKHTRIELVSGHNLAMLRQDTSGDGSYDKRSFFVYGGAPTDILISGTAYMLIKGVERPETAFEFEYDEQGRVVSARQTRGDRSGRTFEFDYAHDYFSRVVERDAEGNQTTLWVVEFDDRGQPTKIKKKLDTTGDFNGIQTLDYDCSDSN
jgi:YD repeat-containing protein